MRSIVRTPPQAFSAVLADERLGYIWIIQKEHQAVGHLVLTLRYAMEYGGYGRLSGRSIRKAGVSKSGSEHRRVA